MERKMNTWSFLLGGTLLMASPVMASDSLVNLSSGYCLDSDGGLAFDHPDIRHDLANPQKPVSAIGWIVQGLSARRLEGKGAISIISCDNLVDNGGKLERAVLAFCRSVDASLLTWVEHHARFPRSMVDCIVPATDAECRSRVDGALRLHDEAPVMREDFAQWVIEDRFAGPRPAWELGGVEIVKDVEPCEQLKLHVLNASHSALAYLGLPRGHRLVREAVANAELSRFVSAMVNEEIAPALAPLDVPQYWQTVRRRFANNFLDHRLAQIAEDGSVKLAQRVFPLLIANIRAGRPHSRLARVIRAWLDSAKRGELKDPVAARLRTWAQSGGRIEDALKDPTLFPDPFRSDQRVRAAMLNEEIHR